MKEETCGNCGLCIPSTKNPLQGRCLYYQKRRRGVKFVPLSASACKKYSPQGE